MKRFLKRSWWEMTNPVSLYFIFIFLTFFSGKFIKTKTASTFQLSQINSIMFKYFLWCSLKLWNGIVHYGTNTKERVRLIGRISSHTTLSRELVGLWSFSNLNPTHITISLVTIAIPDVHLIAMCLVFFKILRNSHHFRLTVRLNTFTFFFFFHRLFRFGYGVRLNFVSFFFFTLPNLHSVTTILLKATCK